MTTSGRRVPLQILAVALLLVGLGTGGFLYWHAGRPDPESEEITRAQEQTRAYELAMQKNVGPVGLMMSQWSDRLGSPRGVAVEVALAGCLAAGVCFFLAAHPPPE